MKRIIVLIFFLVVFAGAAGAQTKDEVWEKVDGSMMAASGEVIPAKRLVGAAYGFIFAALVVWVASVAGRTRRVEDEIESLRKKLHEKK
jgi:hypothetical protein